MHVACVQEETFIKHVPWWIKDFSTGGKKAMKQNNVACTSEETLL